MVDEKVIEENFPAAIELVTPEGQKGTETINKKIRIAMIFSRYGQQAFNAELDHFLNFHSSKDFAKPKGPVGESYGAEYYMGDTFKGDQRIRKIGWMQKQNDFKRIPYEYFKEYAIKLLCEELLRVLRTNPGFIISNSLNIQLRVTAGKPYFYYYGKTEKGNFLSNEENACFDIPGLWLIQTLVGPYFYTHKVDYGKVIEYFMHEMRHFYDEMKGHYIFDAIFKADQDKGRRLLWYMTKKKSAYSLTYLYNTVYNLREEGLAEFGAKIHSKPRLEINMPGIRQYNQKVQYLVTRPLKDEAYNFHDHYLIEDNSASGEYNAGVTMCIFITMYIAKEMYLNAKNQKEKDKCLFTITFGGKSETGYQFHYLNGLLSNNTIFWVSNFNQIVVSEAIDLMGKRMGRAFLRYYEHACDNIGISEENRVMTYKRFLHLKDEAIRYGEMRRKSIMQRNGFIYFGDTDIEFKEDF